MSNWKTAADVGASVVGMGCVVLQTAFGCIVTIGSFIIGLWVLAGMYHACTGGG